MSGAVFLFEREATAPRSEIRKQAVSPAADAIKTSRLYGGFFCGINNKGLETERARTDRKPPVEVFVVSGAVFLFEREATAPRSEIRKQAVSPAADAIKTSRLYGGFFSSHPEEGRRRNADGVVTNNNES